MKEPLTAPTADDIICATMAHQGAIAELRARVTELTRFHQEAEAKAASRRDDPVEPPRRSWKMSKNPLKSSLPSTPTQEDSNRQISQAERN